MRKLMVAPWWRPLPGALLAALVVLPQPARPGEVEIGWEGSAQGGYSFAGVEVARESSRGPSLFARLEASHVYYSFPDSAGETRLSSPGGALGLGLRIQGKHSTIELVPQLEARRTREAADSSSSTTSDLGLAGECTLTIDASPSTRLNASLVHSDLLGYTWARAGLASRLGRAHPSTPVAAAFGPEVTWEISPDQLALHAGARLLIEFTQAASAFDLRVGATRRMYDDGSSDARVYFGVGVWRGF